MAIFDRTLFGISRHATALCAGAMALTLCAGEAGATWSILIADTRTGEFVVGSATCLTGFDLSVETPVVLTGVGAITAQSAVDATGRNRMFVRDRLLGGVPLAQILDELGDFDPAPQSRQYGMITTTGQSLTFSGADNADWAGGITGRIERGRSGPDDDIVYAVQGNILSGPNVVASAVDALVGADTDLPGRLMAGMLAARHAGGDGRCSCSPADPTGCGSPPPAPFKSAHVAYMIGSRADDTDSIRGFYEIPDGAVALAALDIDDDGIDDFAVATGAGTIELFLNATMPGDQVSHLIHHSTLDTHLTDIERLVALDLDANGLKDLAIHNNGSDVTIILQTQPGVFASGYTFLGGVPATAIEPMDVPDLAGEQLVIAHVPPSPSFVLKWEDGSLRLVDDFYPMTTVRDITSADLNGDGIPDLIYVSSSASQLRYTAGRADGTIPDTPTLTLGTSPDPRRVVVADINGDALPDLLVATGSSRKIDCFINTGDALNPAFAPPISTGINAAIIDLGVADFDADGVPDLAVLTNTAQNYHLLGGQGDGRFTSLTRTRLGGTPSTALLTDLNGDGDLDLVTDAGPQLLLMDNQSDGTVPRASGFARGNKFMFLNIANQQSASPDPVDQLVDHFSAWRDGLGGRVDAVQSRVSGRQRVAPGQSVTLTIELRDWHGELLDITDPARVEIHTDGGLVTTGTPVPVEPGVFTVAVTGIAPKGTQALVIRGGDPGDMVRLMPDVTMYVASSPADLNADGDCNYFDVSLFMAAYTDQMPDGDFTADAVYDFHDITAFLDAFNACRGG